MIFTMSLYSSLHFMQEFAGIHLGGDQLANVGDGLGTY